MNIDSLALVTGIGFLLLLMGDILQIIKRVRTAFPIIIVGYFVIFCSFIVVVAGAGAPPATPIAVGVAVLAATPAVVLLWRSLFAEVSQTSAGDRRVISTGTYSICRHPGFLWLTWLLVILVVLYRSRAVATFAAVVTASNLALVTIEDVFIFPRIFVDYDKYKKRVPFLVPRRSGA